VPASTNEQLVLVSIPAESRGAFPRGISVNKPWHIFWAVLMFRVRPSVSQVQSIFITRFSVISQRHLVRAAVPAVVIHLLRTLKTLS